jgi:hypothetical protein
MRSRIAWAAVVSIATGVATARADEMLASTARSEDRLPSEEPCTKALLQHAVP